MNGLIEPGTRLREIEIADRFGVSRTPAREALTKLKTEGLLAEVPGRGLTVSNPSLNEILDAYYIREAVEGLAARLAAERATDAELKMMDALLRQLADAHVKDDVARAIQLSEQFDAMMFRAARNTRLEGIIESLRASHGASRRGNINEPERRGRAIAERGGILKAIVARDALAAELAAKEHLRMAREFRIERALRDGTAG